MCRHLMWAFLGALAAVGGGAYAIDSGGFPSRPLLAGLSASGGNTYNCPAGGGTAVSCFNSTSSNFALGVASSGSPAKGLLVSVGSATTDTPLGVQNAAGSSLYFKVDGAGNITAPNAASVPWAALPFACTTACSVANMAVGQVATVFKNVSTNRASTTTVAQDPDLKFTNLPAGTYSIELYLSPGSTGGTNGFKWALDAVASLCQGYGTGVVNGATYVLSSLSCGTTNIGTISVEDELGFKGMFITSGVTTQALDWAQVVSSATNTTLFRGSYMVLTRLQ